MKAAVFRFFNLIFMDRNYVIVLYNNTLTRAQYVQQTKSFHFHVIDCLRVSDNPR